MTGMPLIVVGDCHAQRAKVEALLDLCEGRGLLDDHRLVFVGDYVDRGPDARGLIDVCIDLQRAGHVFLMGNHELVLGQALFATEDRAHWIDRWHYNYEIGVLASYGAPDLSDPEANAAALAEVMPAAHQEFVRDLPWLYETDDVVVVHAGIDHELDWATQRAGLHDRITDNPKGPSQLCLHTWASDDRPGPHGKTLVTGHRTRREAHVAPGRVMIDVGADQGRPLCAWVSDTGEVLAADAS